MIGLIGLDHRSADMDVRGRLTFTGERLRAALRALAADGATDEVVIVSTCTRTEVYVASAAMPDAEESVKRFLAEAYRLGPGAVLAAVPPPGAPAASDAMAVSIYTFSGVDAARHLFQVAGGLRSMVVGEAQILGQVRGALAAAETEQTVGEELRSLFTVAFKVGKRTRTETELGKADISVASLALRVAADALGGLGGACVLLIGAGRTSQLCAQLARTAGASRIVLANRSAETAAELAAEVGGDAISLESITTALADADVVISATAAPHPVLDADTVREGMRGRGRMLVVMDLAVPPDVDEDVSAMPGVRVFGLDSLRELDAAAVGQPLTPREAEVARAEQIVEEAVRELTRLRAMRAAVPGIAALRRHVDRSEQAELARALAQLEHLAPDDRAVIERFGQRLVDKMFHHLVSRIRSVAEDEDVAPEITMQVLSRLFADPDRDRHAMDAKRTMAQAD